MKSKKELISMFARREEDKVLLASMLDKQELAELKGIPSSTRFLTQEQKAICVQLLEYMKAEYHIFGGFEGAERNVICFLPDYLDDMWITSAEGPVAAINAVYKGNLKLTHRDFLGSLMGTGIVREAIGDILTGENTCCFMIVKELVPFVMQNMTSAGRAVLELQQIELDEIPVPKQKFEEKSATVMSLRLDAVIAAIFNLSRDKAVQYINTGRASINHIECIKSDKQVKDSDIISIKGIGKAQVFTTGNLSRKGRAVIKIKKYV